MNNEEQLKDNTQDNKQVVVEMNNSVIEELPKRKIINKDPAIITKEDISIAQQRIIILNQQVAKQFGFYDDVRRKTLGVINSLSLNVVDKDNLDNIVQDNIVKAPNYWLTYAMSALSYWYIDNKISANKALVKALELDNQKTSLFFAIVCSSNGRDLASDKWLKRYIDSIDPKNVNNEIIIVIDAISSGLFGVNASKLISEKTNKWISSLENDQNIMNMAKDIWIDYFNECMVEYDGSFFPYLKKFSTNFNDVINLVSMIKTDDNILDSVKNIMEDNVHEPTSYNGIINHLISDYDKDELKIMDEIQKNQDIVDGINEQYDECKDLLSKLSIVALESSYLGTEFAKKLVYSLLKNVILDSIDEFQQMSFNPEILPINIQIENWKATTTDASNEKELHESLSDHLHPGILHSLIGSKYFNPLTIAFPVIFVILSFIYRDSILLTIIFCFLAVASAVGSIILTDKLKGNKKYMDKKYPEEDALLDNILAEVVDYSRIWKINNNKYNNLVAYLNEFNVDNYVQSKEVK